MPPPGTVAASLYHGRAPPSSAGMIVQPPLKRSDGPHVIPIYALGWLDPVHRYQRHGFPQCAEKQDGSR